MSLEASSLGKSQDKSFQYLPFPYHNALPLKDKYNEEKRQKYKAYIR